MTRLLQSQSQLAYLEIPPAAGRPGRPTRYKVLHVCSSTQHRLVQMLGFLVWGFFFFPPKQDFLDEGSGEFASWCEPLNSVPAPSLSTTQSLPVLHSWELVMSSGVETNRLLSLHHVRITSALKYPCFCKPLVKNYLLGLFCSAGLVFPITSQFPNI